MSRSDHIAYRKYINDHREFKDEPPSEMCGTPWLDTIRKGECKPGAMKKAGEKMRKCWENYHREKAQSLGFDIDIKKFETTGFRNFSSIRTVRTS